MVLCWLIFWTCRYGLFPLLRLQPYYSIPDLNAVEALLLSIRLCHYSCALIRPSFVDWGERSGPTRYSTGRTYGKIYLYIWNNFLHYSVSHVPRYWSTYLSKSCSWALSCHSTPYISQPQPLPPHPPPLPSRISTVFPLEDLRRVDVRLGIPWTF